MKDNFSPKKRFIFALSSEDNTKKYDNGSKTVAVNDSDSMKHPELASQLNFFIPIVMNPIFPVTINIIMAVAILTDKFRIIAFIKELNLNSLICFLTYTQLMTHIPIVKNRPMEYMLHAGPP